MAKSHAYACPVSLTAEMREVFLFGVVKFLFQKEQSVHVVDGGYQRGTVEAWATFPEPPTFYHRKTLPSLSLDFTF